MSTPISSWGLCRASVLLGLTSYGRAQAMIRGVLASFVGMLLSLLVRFGTLALTDLSSVLLTAGAFAALLLGVDLPFVILAGLALSPPASLRASRLPGGHASR